jgi:hypothetical protein
VNSGQTKGDLTLTVAIAGRAGIAVFPGDQIPARPWVRSPNRLPVV